MEDIQKHENTLHTNQLPFS